MVALQPSQATTGELASARAEIRRLRRIVRRVSEVVQARLPNTVRVDNALKYMARDPEGQARLEELLAPSSDPNLEAHLAILRENLQTS